MASLCYEDIPVQCLCVHAVSVCHIHKMFGQCSKVIPNPSKLLFIIKNDTEIDHGHPNFWFVAPIPHRKNRK